MPQKWHFSQDKGLMMQYMLVYCVIYGYLYIDMYVCVYIYLYLKIIFVLYIYRDVSSIPCGTLEVQVQ